MVIAERGKRRIKVSLKAYEKIFKPKGFVLVEDESEYKSAPEVETDVSEEEVKEPKTTADKVDLDSIPIPEMNKQQLMEYARLHDIDTSGASNVSQARKMIQREIRNRNMKQ